MTEVTTAAAKSHTAKPAARAFGSPKYEIPKWDLPRMEIPEALRETAEKGLAQAKDTCEKAKLAAGQATDLLKDTYATTAKGATDYNLKIIEFARTNTNTAFEYALQLMGVKHPSEFVALFRTCAQAVRVDERADQRTHRTRPEGDHRDY